MKGHIVFSGAALILVAFYLKCSTHGRWPFNHRHKTSLLSQHPHHLRQEIMKRHEDLVQVYEALLGQFDIKSISPEMDILKTLNEVDIYLPATTRALDCEDLTYLKGIDHIGSGVTKLVLKVALSDGRLIALKSVHVEGNDIKRCVQIHGDYVGCHRLATYKLQKEVALLQILQHPGIIQLHGQCYHDTVGSDIRVTAMLELGTPLEMIQLLQTPWEERFKICLELVKLLHYLAHSPLGSIALLDFQPQQFVLVNGSLKVTDMDDAVTQELTCTQDKDCALHFPSRTFAIRCSEGGTCTGGNEKRNLYNAYRYFFTYLLPHVPPPALKPFLLDIMNGTGDLRFGINDTLEAFEKVLGLYKSGMNGHREAQYLKDYIVQDGFRINDTENDFRCWPSYNHLGCWLSVHSANEAAQFCSNHFRCQNFVIGQHRTWTGRWLALFTGGPAKLLPDVNSKVYIKRSSQES
ncbi:extracellular tyrosine-protein kinase PKDCC-like [Pelodytes ibericus]